MLLISSVIGTLMGLAIGLFVTFSIAKDIGVGRVRSIPMLRFWLGFLTILLGVIGGIVGTFF